jgi:tripartite-type tricarboxylate transporter receptor subunit TctC
LHHVVRAAASALALLSFAISIPAYAQDLKDKTIRIVVPFPAGGTADTIARLVTQQATQASGQKFVIENRPGAGTIIGTDAVARAAPDGTTLLIMSNSFFINAIVRASLPYDPMAMEPTCFLVDSPQVLVVNEAQPYRTLKDFVDAAKAQPGALAYGSVGPATTQHIAGEMFKQAAGINLTFVPFTGGAPAVNAILGNHVTSVIANYNEVQEHVHAGKLRALAVSSRERLKSLPDVPTFIELGYKDYEPAAFFGFVAPAKTPKAALTQIETMLTSALNAPEVTTKMTQQGLAVAPICGEDFRAYIKRQHAKYERAIKEAGIKAE